MIKNVLNKAKQKKLVVLSMVLVGIILFAGTTFVVTDSFQIENLIGEASSGNTTASNNNNIVRKPHGTAINKKYLLTEGDDPKGLKYLDTIKANYSWVTMEGIGHMWFVHNISPDLYKWDNVDLVTDWAARNNKEVKYHSVIWHHPGRVGIENDGYLDWYENLPTNVDRQIALKSYVKNVVNRNEGKIKLYDLVNHPLTDIPDEENNYMLTGWDKITAISNIFVWANQEEDGKTKFLINEGGDSLENPTTREKYIKLINDVNQKINKKNNIDGIGLMAHLGSCSGEIPDINVIKNALTQYEQETGLKVYITELDISYDNCNKGTVKVSDPYSKFVDSKGREYYNWFFYQRKAYRQLYELFLSHNSVESVTTWGFYDGNQWRENATFFFDDTIGWKDFNPKPSYEVVKSLYCKPLCDDRSCGYDGCGGTCGTCGEGSECSKSNECLPVGVPDKQYCVSNYDCVKTSDLCCGCRQGAEEEVVNREYFDYMINNFDRNSCTNTGCSQISRCTNRKVVCISNKCVFDESITEQPTTLR